MECELGSETMIRVCEQIRCRIAYGIGKKLNSSSGMEVA